MESSLREIEQREKMKKEKRHIETMIKYEPVTFEELLVNNNKWYGRNKNE